MFSRFGAILIFTELELVNALVQEKGARPNINNADSLKEKTGKANESYVLLPRTEHLVGVSKQAGLYFMSPSTATTPCCVEGSKIWLPYGTSHAFPKSLGPF